MCMCEFVGPVVYMCPKEGYIDPGVVFKDIGLQRSVS